MSSRLTSPAVPPYSSTTIAKCDFDDCISRISSTTRLDSGTNTASRANPRISVSFGLRNCAANRSFERTSPMTSSTVSPTTGRRVKPVSTTTARASLTVKCASRVTMSGRGTITSRTMVSPSSIMDPMRCASSSSIRLASAAASANATSSSSTTGSSSS